MTAGVKGIYTIYITSRRASMTKTCTTCQTSMATMRTGQCMDCWMSASSESTSQPVSGIAHTWTRKSRRQSRCRVCQLVEWTHHLDSTPRDCRRAAAPVATTDRPAASTPTVYTDSRGYKRASTYDRRESYEDNCPIHVGCGAYCVA